MKPFFSGSFRTNCSPIRWLYIVCLLVVLAPQRAAEGAGEFIDVFATEFPLANARGLTFGPDGNLYVSSARRNAIMRFDGTTGAFIDVFVGERSGGLSLPSGLAFGPDGDLYVSSLGRDRVLQYDGVSGAFIGVFASGGSLDAPTGIAFAPDGDLYVSSSQSDEVIQYDGTNGNLVRVLGSGSGLDNPGGIVFGSDDNLYVSSRTSRQVLRFSGSNGELIDVFIGDSGQSPNGLSFGADGNLYVAGFGEVRRFDGMSGAVVGVFVSRAGLSFEGLDFGPDGQLYVSSRRTSEVLRFSSLTGDFIDVFAAKPGLASPVDLEFGPDGNLYVTSNQSSQVVRFNGASGDFIDAIGPIDDPIGLGFGPDENLYISSQSGGALLRFKTATGLEFFAVRGALRSPQDPVFSPAGDLLIGNLSTHEVLRFDIDSGELIDVIVPSGSGGLIRPISIAFGPDGNIYVCSEGTDQVLRYDGATGAFIDIFASGGGLNTPTFLTFGPDDNLYVSSGRTNEVLRYDGSSGLFTDVFVQAGSGGLSFPAGLEFGPDGNLYVASNSNAVLRYAGLDEKSNNDSDFDGIGNAIDGTFNGIFDDQSSDFSDDFTDQHLGGTTHGTIILRGDNTPTVTADDDDGVLLSSSGTGLSLVQMCGPSNLDIFIVPLIDDKEVVVTCGSLTAEVILGPVTLTVGVNVEITIPTGAKAFMEQMPGSLVSVSNVGESSAPDIVVEVDGVPTSVGPNDPQLVVMFDDGMIDAPDDVVARAKPGKVNLRWTPVEADSYDVYRSGQSGGPYAPVGSVTGNVFVDSGLTVGETYFYVIQATENGNSSDNSNEVEVLVPAGRRRR